MQATPVVFFYVVGGLVLAFELALAFALGFYGARYVVMCVRDAREAKRDADASDFGRMLR